MAAARGMSDLISMQPNLNIPLYIVAPTDPAYV
jgi:hypothetical protein